MALYAQAVQSGMGAAQLLATGENAQTKAAYNAAYAAKAAEYAAAGRKNAAEKNIAAIKQDKILTNVSIQMKQDQAEAFAKVNAAASGSSGQSVDDVIYGTERNEAHAIASANKKASQGIESELARINNAQASLLSIEQPTVSTTGELMKAFSSVDINDIRTGAALLSEDSGSGGGESAISDSTFLESFNANNSDLNLFGG